MMIRMNWPGSGHEFRCVNFLLVVLLIPISLVHGECACDEGDNNKGGEDTTLALKFKIGSLASIMVASGIGLSIPMLGKTFSALSPEKGIFFMIKAFAAGVILSTGFVHVLPDAFEMLTSPCITRDHQRWTEFPFTGFVAMLSAIGTLSIESLATAYFNRQPRFDNIHDQEKVDVIISNGDHTHATHSHASTSSVSTNLLRHRVISQVLELGIVVHSVIIGISLGASESLKTIRPLAVALTFHQFFEGIGLGCCITQAKFKAKAIVTMAIFFSLTLPGGIAIGLGIGKTFNEKSPRALVVEGVLNAASAGILIYMSLVGLLAADFMHPRVQQSGRLQLGVHLSLIIGAASMCILAKWA